MGDSTLTEVRAEPWDGGGPGAGKLLPAGTLVKWYRIDGVLGQGGFGVTYLAADTHLQTPVAIKEYLPAGMVRRLPDLRILPSVPSDNATFAWGLQRFIEEAKVLARFDHPNILKVYSVFPENNTAYMVLKYEEGETLESALRSGSAPDEPALRRMLTSLLGGLQVIHDAGFLHRDIKPANILLKKSGAPLLLDFGTARRSIGERTHTLTSVVTPGYAPQEQYYTNGKEQGPWTDVYSVAAVIYRAICGRPPISAIDRGKPILAGEKDSFVYLKEIGAGRYSGDFLGAIDWALQLDRRCRPQSVREWQERLDFAPSTADAKAGPPPAQDAAPPRSRPSFEELLARGGEMPRRIFLALRSGILALDPDIREKVLSGWFAYDCRHNFAEIFVQKDDVKLLLRPLDYPDPQGLISLVPETHGWTLNRMMRLTSLEQVEYALHLVKLSLDDLGGRE